MNYSSNKKFYILFFFIIYLIIFSRGSIAGDYEKIFDISQNFINSDLSLVNFIANLADSKNLDFTNQNSFFKHNFFFFLINIFIIKIFNFLPTFPGLAYVLEYTIALLPGLLFSSSMLITYNTYKKKIDTNLLIISIIFFWFGTYIVNFFSSSAFAESYIFFLLSVRFYLIERKKKNFMIPVIDAFLILIRITCFLLIPLFLYTYFKNNKINFKNLIYYFIPFVGILFFFQLILSTINIESYYIEKVIASFCSNDIVEIIFIYFNRIGQTFFSFSLGLIFTFPIIIIIFISFLRSFNFEDKLKILSILSLISFFALEEYWFLPAGISGNRGLAPFLILLFPNFLLGINAVFPKYPKTFFIVISLSLLMFLPSVYFRSTIGVYAACGGLDGCSIPFRDAKESKIQYIKFEDKLFRCRSNNQFAIYDFRMHPTLYSHQIISNKITQNYISNIYLNNDNIFEMDTNYIVPETLGAKLIFLTNNKLKLVDVKKAKLKNYIIDYKSIVFLIIVLLKMLTFFSLFLILYKNYSKYLKKII